MDRSEKRSPVVNVVAGLFLLSGFGAMAEVGFAAKEGRVSFNLDLIHIPVALGLYHRRSGWRVCALVCLGLGVALRTPLLLMTASGWPLIPVEVFGKEYSVDKVWGVLFVLWLLLLAVWQTSVLMRPRVRREFELTAS